jgi:hypothetical protein
VVKMENTIYFTCDACGESILHCTSRNYVPEKWGVTRIDGTLYFLCPRCSGGSQPGSILPIVRERLARRMIKIEECEQR